MIALTRVQAVSNLMLARFDSARFLKLQAIRSTLHQLPTTTMYFNTTSPIT